MKLIDVIKDIEHIDDALVIFQKEKLSIDGEVFLFDQEECGGQLYFIKDNITYAYLLEINIAKEFIDGWLDNLSSKPTDMEIAQRVYLYAISDA